MTSFGGPAYVTGIYNLNWYYIVPKGTFVVVVAIVLGGVSAFWGSIASEPIYVAWGAPLALGGAVLYRLKRLLEEFRAGMTQAR